MCTRTRFSAHLSLKLIYSVRTISTFLLAYTNTRTHARTNATCTDTTGTLAHIIFFLAKRIYVYTYIRLIGLSCMHQACAHATTYILFEPVGQNLDCQKSTEQYVVDCMK